MKRRKLASALGTLAMAFGLSLVFCAGYLVVGNRQEDASAGKYAADTGRILESRIEEAPMAKYLDNEEFIPDYLLNPNMDMPVAEINGDPYVGVLEIPALGLELSVQSGWSYEGLKKSPCRYAGSAYLGNLVICAHNYETHFGTIKNLEPGDSVIFTDMDGNEFRYEVAGTDEIKPLPDTQVLDTGHGLVLFTCTIGGRTRVVVYCDPI